MQSEFLPPAALYALRTTVCLVALPSEQWLSADTLAERAEMPVAYLRKVLHKLVEGGILDARKGHHGGFRLARPADQISLGDVLRAAGVDLMPRACLFGWSLCSDQRPCPLHEVSVHMRHSCGEWMAKRTLAELDRRNLPELAPEV
jgi:Rrf2 family iron-sulfur cluster assembly transcriptional regulator